VSLLEHIVIPAAEEFGPDLVLVWAGCDDECALAASVCATIEALAGDQPQECVAPDFLTFRAASHVSRH
jgi:acetoin utilization deacetylase AcuC-like enzyme